ncbi:hypothetical protein [Rossellomorea aquimaris]|uniref:hypothetical protein n=1 Tax=Rossellomorea aquimaris TaxID=189382 RepID=UPI0011E9229C|nr:hypothetical protein [Rossellomorea aquimaris]TYS91943.1 hypothetical protein FZC88_07350 [Rossellomorea aquimaris]
MKAPFIKLNGQYYLVNGLQFYKGELNFISYHTDDGLEIAWDTNHDLQTLLKEGEQHERIS